MPAPGRQAQLALSVSLKTRLACKLSGMAYPAEADWDYPAFPGPARVGSIIASEEQSAEHYVRIQSADDLKALIEQLVSKSDGRVL